MFSISNKNKKSRKLDKYLIHNTTEAIQDIIENFFNKIISLLQNNKLVWCLSLVICLVFCIFIGLRIRIDYKKRKEVKNELDKFISYYNKFEKKINKEVKELRKTVENGKR